MKAWVGRKAREAYWWILEMLGSGVKNMNCYTKVGPEICLKYFEKNGLKFF